MYISVEIMADMTTTTSPIHFRVYVAGAETPEKYGTPEGACAAAFKAWNEGKDDLTVCGFDATPGTDTAFWREGSINTLGQWKSS